MIRGNISSSDIEVEAEIKKNIKKDIIDDLDLIIINV